MAAQLLQTKRLDAEAQLIKGCGQHGRTLALAASAAIPRFSSIGSGRFVEEGEEEYVSARR